jgi:DNA-binding NarL/FixJ family response regulator
MSGGYSIFGEPPDDPGRSLTVVIADDQALVRGGFRLILKAAGIDVLAEAADGAQAVEAVLAHRPDVVLMDVRMPAMDGIEATKRILAAYPDSAAGSASPDETPAAVAPRIIILTTFDLDEYVYAALSAGASGFLLKDVTPEHLVAAVQLVRTGDALLAPSITRRLVERYAAAPVPGAPDTGGPGRPVRPGRLTACAAPAGPGSAGASARSAGAACDTSALTPRELEVLGLVARGLSNAEIASGLVLSEATVKTHVARILTKLSLRDRVQAVVLAYETGLVSPATGTLRPRLSAESGWVLRSWPRGPVPGRILWPWQRGRTWSRLSPSSRPGYGGCSTRAGTRRSRRCGPTARRGSRVSSASSRTASSGSGRWRGHAKART